MSRPRLLPRDGDIGWTPFGWLVWLGIFVVPPFLEPTGWRFRGLVLAATAVFLVLYFRGYWVRGRELRSIVVAITALGALFVPVHPGASVFFIYAAAFVGEAWPGRRAWWALLALLTFVLAEAWLLDVALDGWIPATVFGLLIGGVNIHYAEVGRRNARLALAHDEVERLAKLDERERIARDLHDLLGHSLSVVTVKSQLAARLVADDPERARREMEEVEVLARSAMSEVRRAVRGYRYQQLGTELAKARVALESAGIRPHVETSPWDLRPEEESVLALALREAVTNVLRHSGADRCWLRAATEHDGTFVVEVADDGRGIRDATEGSGLTGMRERLATIGGSLELSSEDGARLRLVLPPVGERPQEPLRRLSGESS